LGRRRWRRHKWDDFNVQINNVIVENGPKIVSVFELKKIKKIYISSEVISQERTYNIDPLVSEKTIAENIVRCEIVERFRKYTRC
jgi:hypothetical protein